MALSAGDRLGVYEILGPLGTGGMGAVYRARDPRVGRDVAIKVSAQPFTKHVEREARAIAALNHPNICALFDVGPDYLVMELLEGHPITGPQPLPVVLDIARQLAGALEAAHERGIVHRDLKPDNITITPRGLVKVLDFGLATTPPTDGDPTSFASTDTLPVTDTSAVMGTASYIAPERIRGEAADKRADIWAYGVVLYELLTGRRPFRGASVGDILTAVVHVEPDWSELPAATPPEVVRLLRRCLQKDPKKRLPDIGVARLELDDAATPVPSAAKTRTRPLWLIAAIVTVVVTGASLFWLLRREPTVVVEPVVARFSDSAIDPPLATNFPILAWSPDGRRIVYATSQGLYLRSLSDPAARPIPGTETVNGAASSEGMEAVTSNPAFSPDGQSVAYFAGGASIGGAIKTVPVTGGTPNVIHRMDFPPYGMAWTPDGIVFARSFGRERRGILRLPARGGAEEMLIATGDEFVSGPQLLPDGDTLLFTLASGLATDRWDNARIVAQSLTSGTRNTVVEGGADGRHLPSGHVLYAKRNTLLAVPFDLRAHRTTGSPVPILEGVMRASPTFSGVAQAAIAPTGALVYVSAAYPRYELALIAVDGSARRLEKPPGQYRYPRVSPDGMRFAVEIQDNGEYDVWVGELAGTKALRRLTFSGGDRFPMWSPDGQHIVFQSSREGVGGLFRQRVDGTGPAERLTTAEAGTSHEPESWSPRGEVLLFRTTRGPRYALSMYSVAERRAEPFGGVESTIPPNATFSPDGKWLAYMSREADKFMISVQPFPPTGAKYQVAEGGILPAWSPDGRTLFYFHGPGMFSRVEIAARPVFTPGVPKDLWVQAPQRAMFAGSEPHRGYDTMSDGRFLSLVPAAAPAASPSVHVVLNWLDELQQRVPAR
jgi:serine/threonine-protein kinase